MSDFLDGLTELRDIWAVYDAVFVQFKLEEANHDECELELLLAVIQEETDRYLRRRGLKLSSASEVDPRKKESDYCDCKDRDDNR